MGNGKKTGIKKRAYDFISLSNSFYIPEWKISHDIPCCENAQSGKIKLHIYACTPLIVRHGESMESVGDIYFLPGTSLKGCIRNIMEIMSFSKLHTQYTTYYKTPPEYADKPDLAECIFGYTNGEHALKGRVQFSHSFCITKAKELDPNTQTLGNPFYNTEQKEYATHLYLESNDNIKGWKRYPIQNEFAIPDSQEKTDSTTTFKAINNAEFLAEISYFNLNEIELGALLCALTFDNHCQCFHQIGGVKAFGYGKVSIQILNFAQEQIKSYIQIFKDALTSSHVTKEELQERYDKLISFSSMGNNKMQEFVLQQLYNHLKQKDSFVTLWLKRLSFINSSLGSKLCEGITLLKQADEKMTTGNEAEALEMLKKANDILGQQFIADRINEVEICLQRKNWIFELEKLQKHFKENQLLETSAEEKKKENLNIFNSLLELRNEIDKLFDGEQKTIIFEQSGQFLNNISEAINAKSGKIGLQESLNTNKLGTLSGNLKKWKKDNNIDEISEEDADAIKKKLLSIYNALKPKEKEGIRRTKEWRNLVSIVSEKLINSWSEELQ